MSESVACEKCYFKCRPTSEIGCCTHSSESPSSECYELAKKVHTYRCKKVVRTTPNSARLSRQIQSANILIIITRTRTGPTSRRKTAFTVHLRVCSWSLLASCLGDESPLMPPQDDPVFLYRHLKIRLYSSAAAGGSIIFLILGESNTKGQCEG